MGHCYGGGDWWRVVLMLTVVVVMVVMKKYRCYDYFSNTCNLTGKSFVMFMW